MKKALPVLFGIAIFLLLSATSIINSSKIKAVSNHVVISQIMLGKTGASTDEFIELFNPTGSSVNLANWKLTKKTAAGTESTVIATVSGTIASQKFFLIGGPDYTGTPSADINYDADGSTMSANNTVSLYGNDGTTVIDKVGMGTTTDFEGAAAVSPAAGKSIQRIDPTNDTDNNSVDFALLAIPAPHNSASTGTESPTATPTNTPTSSPTESPSPTATPTSSPTSSPTPTSTPTSTPTATPTATPTNTPTSTPTSSPTATPSSTPMPTPTSTSFPFPFHPLVFTCHVSYITIHTIWFTFNLPQIFCGFN